MQDEGVVKCYQFVVVSRLVFGQEVVDIRGQSLTGYKVHIKQEEVRGGYMVYGQIAQIVYWIVLLKKLTSYFYRNLQD